MGLGLDGILSYPFTKMNSSGTGDLQKALVSGKVKQSELFANATVNKWARYKAFQNTTAVFDRYNGAANSARDLALKAANYGLTNIPAWGATANRYVSNLVSFILLGSTTGSAVPDCGIQSEYWKYIHPSTWGASYPMRALDFEGYFTKAVAPIGNMIGTPKIGENGHIIIQYQRPNLLGYNLDFVHFQFPIVINRETAPTEITILASDMYPCVLLRCMSGTNIGTTFTICSQSKLGVDNSYRFDANVNAYRGSLVGGTWKTFCFLSKDKYSALTSGTPSSYGFFVQISQASSAFMITQDTINFELTIKSAGFDGEQAQYFKTTVNVANLATSGSITRFTLKFQYYSDAGTTEISGSAYTHTYTQTIAAGSSADITYSATFSPLGGLDVRRVKVTISEIVPTTSQNSQTVYQDI